jgi:hypothetical protein
MEFCAEAPESLQPYSHKIEFMFLNWNLMVSTVVWAKSIEV